MIADPAEPSTSKPYTCCDHLNVWGSKGTSSYFGWNFGAMFQRYNKLSGFVEAGRPVWMSEDGKYKVWNCSGRWYIGPKEEDFSPDCDYHVSLLELVRAAHSIYTARIYISIVLSVIVLRGWTLLNEVLLVILGKTSWLVRLVCFGWKEMSRRNQ